MKSLKMCIYFPIRKVKKSLSCINLRAKAVLSLQSNGSNDPMETTKGYVLMSVKKKLSLQKVHWLFTFTWMLLMIKQNNRESLLILKLLHPQEALFWCQYAFSESSAFPNLSAKNSSIATLYKGLNACFFFFLPLIIQPLFILCFLIAPNKTNLRYSS